MTRKSKFEAAQTKKTFKPFVIDLTDDENFNWLHSMRTPEEKKRDREVMEQFKQRIRELEQLEPEQKVGREREDLSKSSQASAGTKGPNNES